MTGAEQRVPIGRPAGSAVGKAARVKLLPASLVDRLPDDWWRPGNLCRVLGLEVHLCDDDHVKSIEVNGRIVAQSRKLFPYGRWD